jgi:Sec7-like guanine-nucleotide exchange factor
MKQKLTSREVARARAAAAGFTPLPLDHPIRFEGPSIMFLSHTPKRSGQKNQMQPKKPSAPTDSDSQSPPRVPKTMDELDRELKEWSEKGIYEAAAHQMRGGPDPSNGPDEKDSEE